MFHCRICLCRNKCQQNVDAELYRVCGCQTEMLRYSHSYCLVQHNIHTGDIECEQCHNRFPVKEMRHLLNLPSTTVESKSINAHIIQMIYCVKNFSEFREKFYYLLSCAIDLIIITILVLLIAIYSNADSNTIFNSSTINLILFLSIKYLVHCYRLKEFILQVDHFLEMCKRN